MLPSLTVRHPELRADTAGDLVRTRAKTFYEHSYVHLTKFHLAASKKGELVEKLAAYPLHHPTHRSTQLPLNATHVRLNNNCVCNKQLLTHSHITELEQTNQAHNVNCYGLSSVSIGPVCAGRCSCDSVTDDWNAAVIFYCYRWGNLLYQWPAGEGPCHQKRRSDFVNSSSVLWWNTRAPSGGPFPVFTSPRWQC